MSDLKKLYVCSALFFLQIIGGFTYPSFGHGDAHLGGGGLGDYGGYHGGLGQDAHTLVSSDHHGGVSIVGAGGSAHKGITLDLTKESGGGHQGLFGGSFIAGGHGGGIGGESHHIQAGHSGLGAYTSALSSYDVGGHGSHAALAASGHDAAEISPVLYSSFKEGEHNFGLHSAALHGGGGGGFESHHAALSAPTHFGGGLHFDHSSGYEH